MEIFKYSGPSFDLYGEEWSDSLILDDGPWPAPRATQPLAAEVEVPGSKSITNRELVLAALADGPSTLRRPLHARDTQLMIDALRALGVSFEEQDGDGRFGPDLVITPTAELEGGVSIDCGLAGTVMRFVPPVAALALGPVNFDGDPSARKRPMGGVLEGLKQLGVEVRDDGRGRLPFSLYGNGKIEGGEVEIDASASSQFVSGLLLAAPRFERGLKVTHRGGALPSVPHIEMTLESLRRRGVTATSPESGVWQVEPGPIAAIDLTIEPDLSNAAPFLLAAVVAGGEVCIPDWPTETTQVGDLLREILPKFGAEISLDGTTLICRVAQPLVEAQRPGVELDFTDAGGELAPNIAAVCALLASESRITGIAHLRGHETDRVAALAAELTRIGAEVEELPDALVIRPGELHGALWQCYEDHRMATSGALVGLAIDGIELDDVGSTSKTLPQFVAMWRAMITGAPHEPESNDTSFLSLGI
ncbi:3-phosphoshikimate 1-carboxyvinyltransferase [Gulosibacter macacae]|uniref:3-phosphoshikimate 1-carboxyvinyltransferase n=1 Tax=Gulosibacter macacae TaxID=2488791 RepID=A0A3P3W2H7_9MICO|nr:3-phosphoshikimate 1-carboxyvinyltransferase [Gulosibacter macacae]RRJ88667.1 3-phosphoshikimate 1-carboxyvinyltransferase [Gulosibacter macacae]